MHATQGAGTPDLAEWANRSFSERGTFMRRLCVAIAVSVITACLAAGSAAAAEKRAGPEADALVLGRAASPALKALRSVADLDTTRAAEVDRLRPQRYDMLVVDGHHLTPGELQRRPSLQNFVAAGKWIAAFDLRPADHEALETYTGFDVGNAEGSDRSEMFVSRVSLVGGKPTVEMINSGPYSQPGTSGLGERRETSLSQDHVRQVARLVDDRIDAEGASVASKLEPVGCNGLPAPNDAQQAAQVPYLQHIGFCYTDAGAKNTPAGYWTRGKYEGWMNSISAPGWPQVSEWTVNHRFDVFLSNPPCPPKQTPNGEAAPDDWCDHQVVSHALNVVNFNPAKGGTFFRMNDTFTTGWSAGQNYIPERAWWTGRIDSRVTPSAATAANLTLLSTSPATPNEETTYSEGSSWNVGFSAGATAGSEGPGGNFGVNAGYTYNDSKTWPIKDWGVKSDVSGNNLSWTFSARQPCDMSKWSTDGRTPVKTDFGNYYTIGVPDRQCFATLGRNTSPCPASPYVSECYPVEPKPLSKGAAGDFRTFGSWRTKKLLEVSKDGKTNEGLLTFNLSTPITLVDTYCHAVWHTWCDPVGVAAPPGQHLALTGPDAENVTIDATLVNPIPIKELKLSATSVGKDGKLVTVENVKSVKAGEVVTGDVVLEKPARMPVTVALFSDKDNAKLRDVKGLPGGGNKGSITIGAGTSTGKFKIDTNDNNLKPGDHITVTIAAFYGETKSRNLLIERPSG